MYQIINFDKHYLTSDLRRGKIKRPSWFKCPVDSPEVVTLIHGHPEGLSHLGVWERMQAWAVKNHDTKGSFVLKGGPMSLLDIKIHCTLPHHAPIEEAVDRLMQLGWIADVPDQDYDSVVTVEELATTSSPHDMTRQNTTGENKTGENNTTPQWSSADGFTCIDQDLIQSWEVAYPAVDIDQEMGKMHAWLIANPAKAKRKLWARFINNWLGRCQESGGNKPSNRVNFKDAADRPQQSNAWAKEAGRRVG
tara:strand:- start:3085 stop:3834 length:750 start_codon:yes stop_codon:yes gene_type:complete